MFRSPYKSVVLLSLSCVDWSVDCARQCRAMDDVSDGPPYQEYNEHELRSESRSSDMTCGSDCSGMGGLTSNLSLRASSLASSLGSRWRLIQLGFGSAALSDESVASAEVVVTGLSFL